MRHPTILNHSAFMMALADQLLLLVTMDGVPTPTAMRDDRLRWGIEPMFSEFKTHDHLDHLSLVLNSGDIFVYLGRG